MLSNTNSYSIDTRGIDEVYDSVMVPNDEKRFCSLNLTVPMELHEALMNTETVLGLEKTYNYPKAHVVFKASKFMTADEWHDQDERRKWDARVIVSFQENAWVDTKTHLHYLKEVMWPVNQYLGEENMMGIVFEDNLSSHNRDEVFSYWREILDHFEAPQFVPKNMTEIIQVVDRHLGIQYKLAVYVGFRKEMMKRLKAARKRSRGADGVTIQTMTPAEKRIMVTKLVADKHEKMLRSGACLRAFHATATFIPVDHLERDKEGNTKDVDYTQVEREVKLQHLPEYKYTEQCPKETVLLELKERQEKEEADRKEREMQQAKEDEARESEERRMRPFVAKANAAIDLLNEIVVGNTKEDAKKIKEATGLSRFIIGGSHASLLLSGACTDLEQIKADFAVEAAPLTSNDIDIFYGDFSNDESKHLYVDKRCIKKQNIEGIGKELNTIECKNLSPRTFLENNDVNITASCIDIDFASGSMVGSIHALPCFWMFLFQDNSERMIWPANMINTDEYGANTCVRIAYKAFQMEHLDITFSLGDIDITKGTIAASGKEKVDEMKSWSESPFHKYQCNKEGSHYVLAKKHKKVSCAAEGCNKSANRRCGHKMCKSCCAKNQRQSGKQSACKLKEHRLETPDGSEKEGTGRGSGDGDGTAKAV